MKNTLKLLSLITLFSALICSCAKEQLQPENEDTESQTGNALVATIALPDDSASKLAYEENGSQAGLSSKWEEGDYIYALKDGKDLVRFNIIKGVGTSTGHFIAYTDYNQETQWKVILGKKITASNGVATCSYLGQDGTETMIILYPIPLYRWTSTVTLRVSRWISTQVRAFPISSG